MRYLKYFEGFTTDQLNDLFNNNKTSAIKKQRTDNNKYNILSKELIDYDISNFKYTVTYNHYTIYPDNRFIELYKKYCKKNNLQPKELIFTLSILPSSSFDELAFNQIDAEYLLPDNNLKGLSIGYKLYKYVLNLVNFIMTNKNNSSDAKNLWYNLLKDNDLYSGTNKNYNTIIKKDINDDKLKSIIKKLEKFNLTYDDELNNKIKELYGRTN